MQVTGVSFLPSPLSSLSPSVDYIGYVYPSPTPDGSDENGFESSSYTPHIINYHSHIFAGLREKYAPRDSHRDAIWQKLQMLPQESLIQYLDQIFSPLVQTISPPPPPSVVETHHPS
jgi:hypothetical protein